jgi:HSP20 family protein
MLALVPCNARDPELTRTVWDVARSEALRVLLMWLRETIDRFLEQYPRKGSTPAEDGARDRRWELDVKEEDGSVVVTAEVAGFGGDDFDVEVTDSRLTLRASRWRVDGQPAERGHPPLEDRWQEPVLLPVGIDTDRVEASYRNGVLTVRMPYVSSGRGRHVPVKQV